MWRNILILASLPLVLTIIMVSALGTNHYIYDGSEVELESQEYFKRILGVHIQPNKIYDCNSFVDFGFDGHAIRIYKLSEKDISKIFENKEDLFSHPKIEYWNEGTNSLWSHFTPNSITKQILDFIPELNRFCKKTEYINEYTPSAISKIIKSCAEGNQVYCAFHCSCTESWDHDNFDFFLLNLEQHILLYGTLDT